MVTTPILQASTAFKSKFDRFENNDLLKKAALPGPGAYDLAAPLPGEQRMRQSAATSMGRTGSSG